MRLTHVDNLQLGVRIGRAVLRASGEPLIAAGQLVDASVLRALRSAGISRVYTTDPLTDDHEIVDILSAATRSEACGAVHSFLVGVGSTSRLRDVALEMAREVAASRDAAQAAVPIYSVHEYLTGHAVNSTLYALLISAELGADLAAAANLAMGMLLHDIGQADLADVVSVPTAMSLQDRKVLEGHARQGFDMLQDALGSTPLGRSIALMHHERIDGSGYPRGLRAEQMPEAAKVAAVADVFAALTADRCHRAAMLNDQAFTHLLRNAAQGFEQEFALRLADRVEIYASGTWVRLRDGRAGIVTGSRAGATVRPRVRLLEDERRQPLPEPVDVDLSAHPDLFIADAFYN